LFGVQSEKKSASTAKFNQSRSVKKMKHPECSVFFAVSIPCSALHAFVYISQKL